MRLNPSDRRDSERFPVARDVEYQLAGRTGQRKKGIGKTVNISSGGVLCAMPEALPPGTKIELSISWPAQLEGKCLLKLVAQGRITRCEGTEVAIQITKHEFHTRSSASFKQGHSPTT